jgi:hypothetical protein
VAAEVAAWTPNFARGRPEENLGAVFPHCGCYFIQIEWITAHLRRVFGEDQANVEAMPPADFCYRSLFVFNQLQGSRILP